MSSFHKRNLPHIYRDGSTYFLTDRLYGSVPISTINALRKEYNSKLKKIDGQFKLKQIKPENILSEKSKALVKSIFKKKKYNEKKMYFKKFDDFLDSNLNEPHWLKIPEVAKMNYDNILFYAKKYFDVWAFCIMSNHIHILMTPFEDAPKLNKIMQDMKKYSGRKGNILVGNQGNPHWTPETYDHILRKDEFNRVLWYILNNPVKAGIVKDWKDYEYTYVNPALV